MYSLGMMLLDMALFKDLTCCYTKYSLRQEIVEEHIAKLTDPIQGGYSESFQTILAAMLQDDSDERYAFADLQAHIG